MTDVGMTEVAIEVASELPPSCARELRIAVIGCMQMLVSDAMMLADEVEDDLVMIKFVRIGPRLSSRSARATGRRGSRTATRRIRWTR